MNCIIRDLCKTRGIQQSVCVIDRCSYRDDRSNLWTKGKPFVHLGVTHMEVIGEALFKSQKSNAQFVSASAYKTFKEAARAFVAGSGVVAYPCDLCKKEKDIDVPFASRTYRLDRSYRIRSSIWRQFTHRYFFNFSFQ